jgi:uncharacterized protein YukE
MGQIVEYGGIEAKLKTIQLDGEQTKTNLDGIDKLIQLSVGPGGAAWDGESASQFKASWDELSAELPLFIDSVEKQALNVQTMLTHTKEADQNGTVNAPGVGPTSGGTGAGVSVNMVK